MKQNIYSKQKDRYKDTPQKGQAFRAVYLCYFYILSNSYLTAFLHGLMKNLFKLITGDMEIFPKDKFTYPEARHVVA